MTLFPISHFSIPVPHPHNLQTNPNPWFKPIAILSFLVVLGVGVWSIFSEKNQSYYVKSSDVFFALRQNLGPQNSFDEDLVETKASPETVRLTPAEKLEKIEGFLQTEHPHPDVVSQALVWKAQLLMSESKYQEALDAFQGAFRLGKKQVWDQALLLDASGVALEFLGKYADAIAMYEKGLKLNIPLLKGKLLLRIAGCYEELKDIENAKQTYQKIINELFESTARPAAELALSLL